MKKELIPTDGRKSFYGKAYTITENGKETLYSYGTPIMERRTDDTFIRLYDGYVDGKEVGFTATTMRHVRAFCGMNKKEFMALPMEGR